jgi:cytochrome c553
VSRLILKILVGAAVAFGAHAQDKKPAAQEGKPAAAWKYGQVKENALALCEGCHGIAGYKTAFPEVYHVPKIGGQQKAYKSGERSHPSMRGIAATLTEENMKELAEYYGGTK